MSTKGLLLMLLLIIGPGDIAKINTAKSEAKRAFLAGDYKKAIEQYTYLIDSAGVKEDEVYMNLANSYFQVNDTARAINSFAPLTMSTNPKLKSRANQQLGVLHNREGKFDQALNYFKQSLKADPTNDDARFNYEMVKKKLEEQKKQEQQQDKNKQNQEQDQENKDQEQKDQEQKEQQDKKKKEQQDKDSEKKDQEDQEKKDEEQKRKEEQEEAEKKDKERKDIPPSVKEKLKEMDMSEEKAKMILDAMKNQEVQYLQQNKRKATKQRDKTKPDW